MAAFVLKRLRLSYRTQDQASLITRIKTHLKSQIRKLDISHPRFLSSKIYELLKHLQQFLVSLPPRLQVLSQHLFYMVLAQFITFGELISLGFHTHIHFLSHFTFENFISKSIWTCYDTCHASWNKLGGCVAHGFQNILHCFIKMTVMYVHSKNILSSK